MSAVTSDTISMNSISCARRAFIFSMNCALCSATVPCVVIASSASMSSRVKPPWRLFSDCATPMISPFTVLIGTQAMLRVTKPVCSSIERLKRGSEYGSSMTRLSPVLNTWPATPLVFGRRISRLMLPCATRE